MDVRIETKVNASLAPEEQKLGGRDADLLSSTLQWGQRDCPTAVVGT
jgi:hypothetical protein